MKVELKTNLSLTGVGFAGNGTQLDLDANTARGLIAQGYAVEVGKATGVSPAVAVVGADSSDPLTVSEKKAQTPKKKEKRQNDEF